jgi:hypothetical protein
MLGVVGVASWVVPTVRVMTGEEEEEGGPCLAHNNLFVSFKLDCCYNEIG